MSALLDKDGLDRRPHDLNDEWIDAAAEQIRIHVGYKNPGAAGMIAETIRAHRPGPESEVGNDSLDKLVSEWTLEPYPPPEASTNPVNLERRVFKQEVRRSWPELAHVLDLLALEDGKAHIRARESDDAELMRALLEWAGEEKG